MINQLQLKDILKYKLPFDKRDFQNSSLDSENILKENEERESKVKKYSSEDFKMNVKPTNSLTTTKEEPLIRTKRISNSNKGDIKLISDLIGKKKKKQTSPLDTSINESFDDPLSIN